MRDESGRAGKWAVEGGHGERAIGAVDGAVNAVVGALNSLGLCVRMVKLGENKESWEVSENM